MLKPEKGARGVWHAAWVGVFVAVYIFAVFYVAFLLQDMVVGASLAASAFIVFGYPGSEAARARCLLGGYACGMVSGVGFALLLGCLAPDMAGLPAVKAAFYALAAGAAAVAMLGFKMGHPPAAAMALALVGDKQVLWMAVASALCVLVLWGLQAVYLWGRAKRILDEEKREQKRRLPEKTTMI